MPAGSHIVDVDDVPADSSQLFRVENGDGEIREAILVRADERIEAWLNYCQHFRHVTLDKGSGATMRNGEIVCTNHGAMFEADSGECTHGPCRGAVLDSVAVTVENGAVFLDDPDYDLVGVGAVEEEPFDLSSDSNIEF